jgi:hypothetical protein
MSCATSHSRYADRKAARDKHRRTFKEQMEHLGKYGFKGPEYRRKTAYRVAPIDSKTQDIVMVTCTYLCMSLLTAGWLGLSLLGTVLCGTMKNDFSFGDFMNILKLFDTIPVDGWAVNTVVSTIMLVFFVSQFLLYFASKCLEKREEQTDFARIAGHLREDKDVEAGQEFVSQ